MSIIRNKTRDYFLVLLLLFFCGNPLPGFFLGRYAEGWLLLLIGLLLKDEFIRLKLVFKTYNRVLFFSLIIFLLQWYILGFVSWLGILNFWARILASGLIIYHLQNKFNFIFFEILFYLNCLSLIGFVCINIAKISFPHITVPLSARSNQDMDLYGIYTTCMTIHPFQNQGMFWEPGAFAGILTLCLALNFNNLTIYWQNYRFQMIIFFIALLTTQSTTGYLTFFVILIFYFINTKNRIVLTLVLPLFLLVGLYTYISSDFLSSKIEEQYTDTRSQDVGEVSSSRFGSIIFDWYYIKKHPIIGNGFSEKTRYADHLYLFMGLHGEDPIGSGNGFSNALASLGIFLVIGYIYLLYGVLIKRGKLYALLVLLIVLMNLQGEQWFNFPIYPGLIFINIRERKTSFNPLASKII